MSIRWKLREKLTALILSAGLIPLVVVIIYVGISISGHLKNQAFEYLKVKVDSYARMAEVRSASIEGNLDIIKEQLMKSLKADLIKEAAKEKYFDTGYLAIFQPDGTCVYHPKAELRNNKTLYETYDWVRAAVDKKQGRSDYTFGGVSKISYLAYIKPLDWIVWAAVPSSEALAAVRSLQMELLIFLLITAIVVAVLGALFAGKIARRAREISSSMMDIAQGEADLSKRLPVNSTDEVGEIASWFNTFVENLEEVITRVKDSSLQVDSATKEVAAGAQGLSQATQEQASAIEEVAATIEEMTSSIKHNAENATDGRQKATEMVRMAGSSGEAAQELVLGMSEISAASKKIGDIIVTVNEVAFQTNLLALNAAVEAARAGEHGKGFAVVAEEVRALAQRSAEAARQIKALIEDTVNKIAAGDIMVKKSGESLEQIIRHIQDLSQVMEEIAAASSEQASGVDELNRAIAQIDTTTQQNASTVEELASTSDSLSNEAKDLADTVDRFKVTRETESTRTKKSPTKKQPQHKTRMEPAKTETVSEFEDDFEEF
ncbi:MAG TPA: methyl-accepting chemotaxis protein [Deltaproteobacteria bacterium]|nr:methyl-accepting chemotaxis protein [Deltaproteobacteria bacterium]HPI93635.1 methyl-accepting chemotaxis protein [Deltaproteobacteria bacterium]HPR53507.1 methyl-accepting chemotaxis protein [Deltaproteobacteria bacterium]HPR53508.1 methyl-accepting chemotaxis protein [Deltaproteobacteria bacterium]HXK46155.1 methyl-accepting chemotaxis protein [Deltaproteobacteria bacterium]